MRKGPPDRSGGPSNRLKSLATLALVLGFIFFFPLRYALGGFDGPLAICFSTEAVRLWLSLNSPLLKTNSRDCHVVDDVNPIVFGVAHGPRARIRMEFDKYILLEAR